jgi:hypothetical protein
MISQFTIIQYGYLGLLAFMVYRSSQLVRTYITATNPPKSSISLLIVFLLLSVIGGVFGYLWAGKDLEASQKRNVTAAIIQQEITNARSRLNSAVAPLYSARNKALEESVNFANIEEWQVKARTQAQFISQVIDEQELQYQKELDQIATAFSSLGDHGKAPTK